MYLRLFNLYKLGPLFNLILNSGRGEPSAIAKMSIALFAPFAKTPRPQKLNLKGVLFSYL